MKYDDFLMFFKSKYGLYSSNDQYNFLLEEIQKLILGKLYSYENFKDIYFMGGTNLRLSYGLNRFSEDLDFSIDEKKSFEIFKKLHISYKDLFNKLEKDFKRDGFTISLKPRFNTNVKKTFFNFDKVLQDLKIAPEKDRKLKIKIEIDTNVPRYSKKSISQIDDISGNTYKINILNISTTFAGKMSAILLRTFNKGRDYYDILWYFKENLNTPINLKYLNENIRLYNITNKEKTSTIKNYDDLKYRFLDKVSKLNINTYISDMSKFILDKDKKKFIQDARDIKEILEVRAIKYFSNIKNIF